MCDKLATQWPRLLLQLDRPETKPEISLDGPPGVVPDDEMLASRFRHSGWKRRRQQIYDSLHRTDQTRSRIESFADCGSTAYVYRAIDDPNVFKLGGSSCRDRFCLPCAIDRSRCLAANVMKVLGKRDARFVTLTLRQNDDTLSEVIDKLYISFRRLRERRFWKRHVKGGCAFVEVLWSEDNQAWNVHLHAVVHGTYLPKHDLSREWYKVTGDSFIVKIKFVEDDKQVARYVAKYVSKPFNDTFMGRKQRLDEVVTGMMRRRLCLTFGDWRGIKLTESPNERDWISLGTFHDVVTRALENDRESLRAIQTICGERTHEVLDEVKRARPPPIEKPMRCDQLTFSWPAIDNRF